MSKLTLSINEKVREAAKVYAQQNNTSISRLVEDYLINLMTRKEKPYSKTVSELIGFAELENPALVAKEEKLKYLTKKYLQE